MLGRDLVKHLPAYADEVVGMDLPDLDVVSEASAADAFEAIRPDAAINCAAMTAVDDCEDNEDAAYLVNAVGAGNVARVCARRGCRLIHLSTDYVFSGEGPHTEDEEPKPLNAYGRTKLEGERMVLGELPSATVLRTAWLYGPGGPSFLHTILKLSRKRRYLDVVNDQRGNPTWTLEIEQTIEWLLGSPVKGVLHAVCTGSATWFDFANYVIRDIFQRPSVVRPCTSEELGRRAKRPSDSRLDCSRLRELAGWELPPWRDALMNFAGNHPNG